LNSCRLVPSRLKICSSSCLTSTQPNISDAMVTVWLRRPTSTRWPRARGFGAVDPGVASNHTPLCGGHHLALELVNGSCPKPEELGGLEDAGAPGELAARLLELLWLAPGPAEALALSDGALEAGVDTLLGSLSARTRRRRRSSETTGGLQVWWYRWPAGRGRDRRRSPRGV
jgi:hypothetical protein